jgi:hypothetical protein
MPAEWLGLAESRLALVVLLDVDLSRREPAVERGARSFDVLASPAPEDAQSDERHCPEEDHPAETAAKRGQESETRIHHHRSPTEKRFMRSLAQRISEVPCEYW